MLWSAIKCGLVVVRRVRMYGGLLLLLLHHHPVTSMDGCPGEDEYLCVDTCLHKWNTVCLCGGQEVDSYIQWCCPTAPCTSNVSCPGALLPLTSPCNGACNFHPEDQGRDTRSHIPCRDGHQCVREVYLCYGEAFCEDSSDLAWCQDSQRLEETCIYDGFSRCNVTLGLPGQCSLGHTGNQFQCLDRSDVTPYTKREEGYDFSKIQPCNLSIASGSDAGMTLPGSGYCERFNAWCTVEESTDDKNNALWFNRSKTGG